jgi:pimeloyl-ACP methyl ester carboxylesterase
MKNISNTDSYTFKDFFFLNTVRILSSFIGAKGITKPFWNRWRASMLSDEELSEFLNGIKSIDDWPLSSQKMIDELEKHIDYTALNKGSNNLDYIKKMSFLAHLGQWGCLEINEIKISLYKKSRDYYKTYSEIKFQDNYKRIDFNWKGKSLYGNLHMPSNLSESSPMKLIIIVHGMDDSKEEHLPSIEAFIEAGFACLCIDGPGQAESLFIDSIYWSADFHEAIIQATDKVLLNFSNIVSIGLLGISWGGLWCYKIAANDSRIKAIYDLGGPINSNKFSSLPFFFKSKFCQVLGIKKVDEIPHHNEIFSIDNDDFVLGNIKCPVRIVHGDKDPLVNFKDKIWLNDKLKSNGLEDISLVIHKNGDHCCTQKFKECRIDAIDFFNNKLNN